MEQRYEIRGRQSADKATPSSRKDRRAEEFSIVTRIFDVSTQRVVLPPHVMGEAPGPPQVIAWHFW